jgi:hypothetical protein
MQAANQMSVNIWKLENPFKVEAIHPPYSVRI